jgi:histidinol-phosphate phosphatase family protein
MRPAVFLDRDGTVVEDTGYLADAADVRLLPGAAEAIRSLSDDGYAVVVVSNQSGVARGIVSPDAAAEVHDRLVALLEDEEAHIDGAYYCFHGPDAGCDCRKPAAGLLRRAVADLDLDVSRSFAVGDAVRDVEAGASVGCVSILLADNDVEGWRTAPDLRSAAALILRMRR